MAGLGKRGQDKVNATPVDELFRKTDNTLSHTNTNTQSKQTDSAEKQEPIRKQYVLAYELSEKLRLLAFQERRKEVDIVREALEEYFVRRKQ